MRFEEVLRSRRSVRSFGLDVPPRELLEKILEHAVSAPSASNKQPWRFVVVRRRSLIDQMSQCVRRSVAQILLHLPNESQAAFAQYAEYFTRFEQAPAVIAIAHRGASLLSHLVGAEFEPELSQRIERLERDSGLVGSSLALMNLLLAVHHAGLGASAMTGPLVAAEQLQLLLDLPSSWELTALVPVGYPSELPTSTQRKPVERVTRWID